MNDRDRMNAWRIAHYAQRFMGVHYNYGTTETRGDDPVGGFDCSGLVSECLRSIGLIGNSERLSAQMFYDLFSQEDEIPVSIEIGCLVFYGKSKTRISHIAIAINKDQVIEAGGGSSSTHEEHEAAVRNAFVRIRPIHYRSDFVCAIDIFKK